MRKIVRGLTPIAVLAAAYLLAVSAPAEAACAKSVTLYNANWCPYCKQVRALLGRYHIPYSLIEVTTPGGEAAALKKFGDTSVPRTVIGGAVVTGYDPARIKQLLCLK